MKVSYKLSLITCMLTMWHTYCYHKVIKKKLVVSYPLHTRKQNAHQPSTPPITIWVHGTRFIRRPLSKSVFHDVPKLKLAKDVPDDHYLYSIAKTLSKIDPEKFPWNTFYLFGWSGKLSAQAREEAASSLYRTLSNLAIAYKKRFHTDPVIRMITHSHGGTVVLNLAKLKKTHTFQIAELILLACPVQKSTRTFINDPLFKKAYAVCSSLDMIQVLAPQFVGSVYRTKKGHERNQMHWPPFSQRTFPINPNLTQVKIKMNGRALFHGEFNSKPFVRILPQIITTMNSWKKQHLIDTNETYLLCIYTPKKKRLSRNQASHLLHNRSRINPSIS